MSLQSQTPQLETVQAIVREVAQIAASESAQGVNAECCSTVLAYPQATKRAYLLLHGYANCPAQYSHLSRELYERGHNVYAPLAPGHGRSDHSPEGLSKVSATDLMQWVTTCVRRAAQLGESLTVVGFSFGGVAAAWAAMNLGEVDEVTLLAPAFLPYGWPTGSGRLLLQTIRRIPDRRIWWDPVRKQKALLAPHVYPRYTSRGIGSVFELGQVVLTAVPQRTHTLSRATLVINDNDYAINRRAAQTVLKSVVAPNTQETRLIHIPSANCWPHDFIDPLGPNACDETQATQFILDLLGE